jgi:hypothetical protein
VRQTAQGQWTAAMSNARYSQPNGWTVGGIFENQFPAQVSINCRQFREFTLNLNFKCMYAGIIMVYHFVSFISNNPSPLFQFHRPKTGTCLYEF